MDTEYIKTLVSNPWIVLATLIIGILGFPVGILGVYLTVRAWKRKTPKILKRSSNLVEGLSDRMSKVKILFNNAEVTNLTITKIAFWNAGNETISRDDITVAEPLII